MAGPTGLEPATSGVTGQRSNQLSYGPLRSFHTTNGQSLQAKTFECRIEARAIPCFRDRRKITAEL